MEGHAPPMVRDKAGLLEQIEHYRATLDAVLEPLSEAQMTAAPAGGWSIKDHLVHITAWEQSIVALLQGRPRYEGLGVDATTYLHGDTDTINEQIYTQNRDRPLADVLVDFRSSYRQVRDILDGLTDADLQQTYSHYLPDEPGQDSGAPVARWVAGNTIGHYSAHLALIQSLAGPAPIG